VLDAFHRREDEFRLPAPVKRKYAVRHMHHFVLMPADYWRCSGFEWSVLESTGKIT